MEKTNTKKKNKSLFADVFRRFTKSKTALVASIVLIIIILVAIFADVLIPYNKAIDQSIKDAFMRPCKEHWLGTDLYGRDVLARIVHGSRYSLAVGFICTFVALFIATILGSAAGYFGGVVDNIIMRIMDVMISIPSILLMFCIVAVLGTSGTNLIVSLSIASIPGFTRIVRAVTLTLSGADYIEAARANGASDAFILFKHIVPNAIGPIIVQGTMNLAGTILAASAFSYMGLGFQTPTPEWGLMLSEAKDRMRDAAYLCIFPGVAIIIVSMCFNLMGDGLRDALDPRLKD